MCRVSPLRLRWAMESFQRSEHNEVVSVSAARIQAGAPASWEHVGTRLKYKEQWKRHREGRVERQDPALGDSAASGAAQSSPILHRERITASRPSFQLCVLSPRSPSLCFQATGSACQMVSRGRRCCLDGLQMQCS